MMTPKNIVSASLLVGLLIFSNFMVKEKKAGYYLNSDLSMAEWKGVGKNVEHIGSFSVSSKELLVEKGQLKGGSFIIPISSIKDFDLPDEVKPVLLNHLKSADFFNIALYPEAQFDIVHIEPYKEGLPDAIEGANHLITGNFTMLGITKAITFPAKIEFKDHKMKAEATLKLDRTLWGMNYGADPSLEDHYIHPIVDIHLKLFADRN